jgi:hypothetical protein
MMGSTQSNMLHFEANLQEESMNALPAIGAVTNLDKIAGRPLRLSPPAGSIPGDKMMMVHGK